MLFWKEAEAVYHSSSTVLKNALWKAWDEWCFIDIYVINRNEKTLTIYKLSLDLLWDTLSVIFKDENYRLIMRER